MRHCLWLVCLIISVSAARALEPAAEPVFPVRTTVAAVPVLMYHRATPSPSSSIDITPARFEQHLAALARQGCTSISMRLWAAAQDDPTLLPDTPVVITFDDGWQGQYRHAAPLLERYGFTATFYLYTDVIRAAGATFMGWQELADLVARGHEIGGHTLSHPRLTRLRPEALQRELRDSRALLEEKLGITVTTFAYPYGDCNDAVITAVADAGYLTAVSTEGGRNAAALLAPYRVRRINVGHRTTAAQVCAAFAPSPLPVLPLAAASSEGRVLLAAR